MYDPSDLIGIVMTDATADVPEKPARSKKLAMVIWLILAGVGAGVGFYAVQAGFVPTGANTVHVAEHQNDSPMPLPDIAFVEIDPIMITLGGGGASKHLRFRAQLEVDSAYAREVESIMPRIVDVLNSYLRALEVKDLSDPLALTWLRAQMLRRIIIVSGRGRVRDLLIMDFLLN